MKTIRFWGPCRHQRERGCPCPKHPERGASSPHSLPSVEECDERIAEAQHVLDHLDDFDFEVHVQADKDRRRWEFNRHFAERVASLEEQLESSHALCRELYEVFYPHLDENERVRLRAVIYGDGSNPASRDES